MPILGVDDLELARLPRIGNLRKGAPKQTKEDGTVSRPGQDLKWWRFTSDNPEIEAVFNKAFGTHPVSIPVMLPYIEYAANWNTCKERWVAGGLEHRCDGKRTSLIQKHDGQTSYYSDVPEPCPCLDNPGARDACKPTGTLYVMVRKLLEAGYFGCVQMQTHSINDIISIGGVMRACYGMSVGGDLRGVEFDLSRVQRSISVPGPNGKRVRRVMWFVELSPSKRWFATRIALIRERAYSGDIKQLTCAEAIALPDHFEADEDDVDEELDDYPDYPDDEPETVTVQATVVEEKVEPQKKTSAAQQKKTSSRSTKELTPEQEKHWFNADKNAHDEFLQEVANWAKKGRGVVSACEALGVAKIADFSGTLDDALGKMREWGVMRVINEMGIKPSDAHKALGVGDFSTIKDGHDLLIDRLEDALDKTNDEDADEEVDGDFEQIPF